jgi:hypothetical protein
MPADSDRILLERVTLEPCTVGATGTSPDWRAMLCHGHISGMHGGPPSVVPAAVRVRRTADRPPVKSPLPPGEGQRVRANAPDLMYRPDGRGGRGEGHRAVWRDFTLLLFYSSAFTPQARGAAQ